MAAGISVLQARRGRRPMRRTRENGREQRMVI
jgi:hypothetical protein